MTKRLQELPSLITASSSGYMLVKQSNGAVDIDYKITIPNFLKDFVPRSMIGDQSNQILLLEDDSMGRPALPAVSGEKLTNLTIPTGNGSNGGLLKLSDSLTSSSNSGSGVAATPYAIRQLNTLKASLSGAVFTGDVTTSTKLLAGGEIISSTAALQVRGIQRTGNIYLHTHSGGALPDATRVSDHLTNTAGDLYWYKASQAGKVWTSLNGGTGSGLDADTVDGFHASSFGKVTESQTWTKVNSFNSDYTAFNTGGSVPDATVPSSLKGIRITGGNQILNIDVSSTVNGGAYLQTRHLTTSVYPDAYYKLELNPLGGAVNVNGNTVWHRGNDGAGSGLDADLLDGKHGSEFATSTHTHNILYATDDRGVLPNTTGIGNTVKAIRPYFRTATAGGGYMDFLVLDTYSDSSGGGITAIAANKTTGVLYHHFANFASSSWGTAYEIYSARNPQPSVTGSSGSCTGNAATATRATSANKADITTTFSGQYPVTVNVNGLLYSHAGMQFNGSAQKLTIGGDTDIGGRVAAKWCDATTPSAGSWGHSSAAGVNLTANSSTSAYNLCQIVGGARVQALGKGGNTMRIYSNSTNFFQFSNNVLSATTVTGNSDRDLKENIKTIPNALDKVLQLRGVEYDWKEDGRHDIGVVAQEVEEVFPEVVHKSGEGVRSVDYGHLVGALIESIKELKAEVDDLKSQINK